jgi:hypothetical protein
MKSIIFKGFIVFLILSGCTDINKSNVCTVTFDVGDADSISSITIESGNVLDLSQYTPTSRTGGELLAWYNGNEKLGTSITVSNDITLKAIYKWSKWIQTSKPESGEWVSPWPLNDNSINCNYNNGKMKITVNDNIAEEYNRWLASVAYAYSPELVKKILFVISCCLTHILS